MEEKDPGAAALIIEQVKMAMPYLSTLLLATFGGVVNHITTLRKNSSPFRWRELAFDLLVSGFAGLLTFYFCRGAGIGGEMSAVLIAISGHMGTRAIAGFELIYTRLIGVKK
jgi:hypothetical protein